MVNGFLSDVTVQR